MDPFEYDYEDVVENENAPEKHTLILEKEHGKKIYFFDKKKRKYFSIKHDNEGIEKIVDHYNKSTAHHAFDVGNNAIMSESKPDLTGKNVVTSIENGFYSIKFSDQIGYFLTEEDLSEGDKYVDLGGELEKVEQCVNNFYTKEHIYKENNLRHKMGVLLYGPPGCHAKDTEILMYDGSIKKVQDVVVGDKLMGPDSKPREVLQLARNRQEMVKINPVKGEEFVVNRDHILHLTPSGKNQTIRTPVNMKFSDYIKQSKVFQERMKLTRTGVDFEKKDLDIDPYILGLWLGDGTSHKASLTTKDDVLKDVWVRYGQSLGLRNSTDIKRGCMSIHLVDIKGQKNILINKFEKYNLFNNKHIPRVFLTSSYEDRLELLAGLIDTDGSRNCSGYEIIQKRKNLADDIVFLCRSLGFAAYNKECVKKCTNSPNPNHSDTYYRVTISGDLSIVPVLLGRKKCQKRKQIKDVLRTGFSYELLPEDDYYGFSLDGDHLYLTSDFTIHHNTGKSMMINRIMKQYKDKAVIIFVDQKFPSHFLKKLKDFDQKYIFIFEELTQNIESNRELAQILLFLDGENSLNQQLCFATTNYPEHLPQNLASRPGRFDKLFHIDNPSPEVRRKYLQEKLGQVDEEIVKLTKDHSIAYLREMIIASQINDTTLQEEIKKNKERMKLIEGAFQKPKRQLGFGLHED